MNVSVIITRVGLLLLSLKSIGPSLPILNTWVAMDVQEAFYSAFHAEQACQAGLLSHSLPGHTWQRNIGLEFIILQAKTRRAQAEINLYSIAIAKDRGSIFSNNTCGREIIVFVLNC